MSSADHYRIKAVRLAAEARDEAHVQIRAELLSMAQSYLRLAEQADKNSHLDVYYEPPLRTVSPVP